MTVPAAYDWTSLPTPGATPLNAGVRDPINFLLDPPHVRAYRATAGSAIAANTPTVVNLDGESYDSTGTMHSLTSNLGRLVAPFDGMYQVYAQIGVVQNTGAGTVVLTIRQNGTTAQGDVRVPTITSSAVSTVASVLADVPMSAGDYVEMLTTLAFAATPAAGVNITYMQMRWFSVQ